MANYLSDRTGASIDTVLDNADAGNTGKASIPSITTGSADSIITTGSFNVSAAVTDLPTVDSGTFTVNAINPTNVTQIYQRMNQTKIAYMAMRLLANGNWSSWQELYHTGNTSTAWEFGGVLPTPGSDSIYFDSTTGRVALARPGVGSSTVMSYHNDNGQVGSIATSGSATAFNTSSDPRLKDFAEAPTDSAINAEFNSLYSCFRTFNWKNDPQGDLVWGFDAHACIDAGTGMGSEGQGSRSLNLGDVYETIPAVTENRVVNDVEGNPTSEIETVVITAAIEKKVSPAGVDQSKAVPILLAKIEQLERRLTLAGL